MVPRLSGWQQVRAALYLCIHRGPSGRCLVRIASMESCCPRCVGPMDSVRAGSRLPLHYRRATSPHPTLPYPDRTYRTLPACPCTMPILLCVSLT